MENKTKWSIDPTHSEIAFKVKHLMIANVKGSFKQFDASIYTLGNDFKTAEIDVWIDVSSINTGDTKRDEHLKSVDFFDAGNHKQITFVSTSFQKTDSISNYEIWGKLTIKNQTKNIKLNAHVGGIMKDPWGNEKAGFEVVGTINRSDWGLVWNTSLEAGGLMVSDEIHISCELELINKGTEDLKMVLESSKAKN